MCVCVCVCVCVTTVLLHYPEGFKGRLGSGRGGVGGGWCGSGEIEGTRGGRPLTSLHFCGLSVTTTAAASSRCGDSFSAQSCKSAGRGGVECRGHEEFEALCAPKH